MVFNFKDMLGIGNRGETLILRHYPELRKHTECRGWDFDHEDGSKWELKTDTKAFSSTDNLFIERWSVYSRNGTELDDQDKKPGGLWQSTAHGVDSFLYMYMAQGETPVLLLFPSLKDLLARVECLLATYSRLRKPYVIWNKGYEGMGYLIPRYAVDSLYGIATLQEESDGIQGS